MSHEHHPWRLQIIESAAYTERSGKNMERRILIREQAIYIYIYIYIYVSESEQLQIYHTQHRREKEKERHQRTWRDDQVNHNHVESTDLGEKDATELFAGMELERFMEAER